MEILSYEKINQWMKLFLKSVLPSHRFLRGRAHVSKMIKKICFDMDGTIANLYGVENWLYKLEHHDETPYIECEPLVNMDSLNDLLIQCINLGIEIVIISWLAGGSTKEYDRKVRQAKLNWLDDHNFPYTEIHMVKYGTTKANTIRNTLAEGETAILFDDNEKVRKGWTLGTAYAETAIFETICEILEKNMRCVANLINAAYQNESDDIPVLFFGGVSSHFEILFPFIRKYVAHKIMNLEYISEEQVNGALLRAKQLLK